MKNKLNIIVRTVLILVKGRSKYNYFISKTLVIPPPPPPILHRSISKLKNLSTLYILIYVRKMPGCVCVCVYICVCARACVLRIKIQSSVLNIMQMYFNFKQLFIYVIIFVYVVGVFCR